MLFRRFITLVALVTGLTIGLAPTAHAQMTSFEGVSTSAIENEVRDLVSRNMYVAAVPGLRELYNRLKETDPDESKMEGIYYYLAIGLLSMEEEGQAHLEEAIKIMTEYRDRFGEEPPEPANFNRILMYLGDAYQVKQDFPNAIEAYRALYPRTLSGRLSFRLEVLEKLSDAYFYDRPMIEQTTQEDGQQVTRSVQREPMWDEAIPVFETFVRDSNDTEKIAKVGSYLLQGYIAKQRFEEAFQLIPRLLVESPARYDVSFNVALLRGGDQMYDQDEFSKAAFFYALTLTVEQMQSYFENRKEILEGQKRALQNRGASADRIRELQADIAYADAQLKILKDVSTYTSALKYRQARTFLGMNRDWEAFWAFLRLWEEMPDDANAEEFLFTAFAQAVQVGQEAWALRLGDKYTSNPDFNRYSEMVVVNLAQLYLNLEQYDTFRDIAITYVNDNPPDSSAANQLVYLLGAHFMDQQMYEELQELFSGWFQSKGEASIYAAGLLYWQGMSYLFTDDYPKVVELMSRLVEIFPGSPYAEDARFRIGVARYGMGEFEVARNHFEDFVADSPDSVLRPEAEVFLGDIAASEARVDEALEHYNNVETYGSEGTLPFITHAVFQSAKLLEANRRYNDMLNVLSRYVNTWRDFADISNAVYQLGRAYELMGEPLETVREYIDAIERFGNVTRSFGIDYIIEALPDKYRMVHRQLKAEHERRVAEGGTVVEEEGAHRSFADFVRENTIEDFFRQMYDDAVVDERWTMALRMESALMDLPEVDEIVPTYSITNEVFQVLSPGSLVYVARRYADDPSVRDRAYQMLYDEYQGSEFVRFYYLDRGNILLEDGLYEDALELFQAFSRRYPTAPEAPEAALREADCLIALRRFDEALKRLEEILRTRDWRGPAFAEARFKMGMIQFDQGNYGNAHAQFQQTYLLFGFYREWAARAFLMAGESLERLGERDKARSTYEAFMDNPNLRDTEEYLEIQSRLLRI